MKVHHTGHHQAYTDKLNAALAELHTTAPALAALPIAKLLQRLPEVPDKVRGAIRNHGGGYVNHELFWNIMGPGAGGEASGAVGAAIAATFGSFAKFKEDFTATVRARQALLCCLAALNVVRT
jgi:superoxide dismutase, Fe-Mn family